MLNTTDLLRRFSPEDVTHMQQLANDPGWRAALMILTSEIFGADDGRVWNHVDLRGHSIYFQEMLTDGTFSSSEKKMLEIAASLFNDEVAVNLWTMFCSLDTDASALALRAIGTFAFDDQTFVMHFTR